METCVRFTNTAGSNCRINGIPHQEVRTDCLIFVDHAEEILNGQSQYGSNWLRDEFMHELKEKASWKELAIPEGLPKPIIDVSRLGYRGIKMNFALEHREAPTSYPAIGGYSGSLEEKLSPTGNGRFKLEADSPFSYPHGRFSWESSLIPGARLDLTIHHDTGNLCFNNISFPNRVDTLNFTLELSVVFVFDLQRLIAESNALD